MTTTPPRRRRWYQFGLRTMFVVVTVFAVWLGWELKFVRERDKSRRWIVENGGDISSIIAMTVDGSANVHFESPANLPFWRRWMGDELIGSIWLAAEPSEADIRRLRRQFPEAKVIKRRK
jgi:hypothetical protein